MPALLDAVSIVRSRQLYTTERHGAFLRHLRRRARELTPDTVVLLIKELDKEKEVRVPRQRESHAA